MLVNFESDCPFGLHSAIQFWGEKSVIHWLSDPHLTFIYWAAIPYVIPEESRPPNMAQSSCLWLTRRPEKQCCFFCLTFSANRHKVQISKFQFPPNQAYHLFLMCLEDHSKVDHSFDFFFKPLTCCPQQILRVVVCWLLKAHIPVERVTKRGTSLAEVGIVFL